MRTSYRISGSEKASILLIALGKELSSQIMKHLYEDEIEQLTIDITNLRTVDSETKEAVIDEFYELCLAQKYVSEGGIEYAKQILIDAFGSERAYNLIEKITSSIQVKPFDFLRKADAAQTLNFIQNESPQTIALISSYLLPQQAAMIISVLPPEKQAEIIEKIANMGSTSPENIQEVARVLERKFSAVGSDDYTTVGGIQAIVDILNSADISTEKRILSDLEEKNSELAEEIRRRMFVFDDIVKLDSRAIQRVLKDVDNKDLTIALKGSSKEVMEVVLSNMSKRMQEMIKDDLEYMPPVRMRDVEEAQQKILNIIRKLEDMGEIYIARNEGDEMFV
jgi:flagellar motor switch protein FliG